MREETPAQQLGFKVGDSFVVVREVGNNGYYFRVGETVTLEKDDGTHCPLFKWTTRENNQETNYSSYYMNFEKVEKIEQPKSIVKTEAQKAGLIIGNKYIVTDSPRSLGWFPVGAVITFIKDDETYSPHFEGPAKKDNYGKCGSKAGDLVKGYENILAVVPYIEQKEQPKEAVIPKNVVKSYRVATVEGEDGSKATVLEFNKILSQEQIASIFAIVTKD